MSLHPYTLQEMNQARMNDIRAQAEQIRLAKIARAGQKPLLKRAWEGVISMMARRNAKKFRKIHNTTVTPQKSSKLEKHSQFKLSESRIRFVKVDSKNAVPTNKAS